MTSAHLYGRKSSTWFTMHIRK